MTLFTDEEFGARYVKELGGLRDADLLEFFVKIESGKGGLPRASNIGACARHQYHELLGLPATDPTPSAYAWTAIMGFMGQEVVLECMRRMGYEVRVVDAIDSEGTLSGHLDAEVRGLDLGDEWVVCDVKLRNVFAFKQLVRDGLPLGDVQMYLQMQRYMQAQHRQKCLLLVAPHDLSGWKLEITKYKLAVHEPVIHRIWLEADKEAQSVGWQRAKDLLTAQTLGVKVHREFDPTSRADSKFPCGWCSTRTHCFADDLEGGEMMRVEPIPTEWTEREL